MTQSTDRESLLLDAIDVIPFRAGREEYALPLSAVREVARSPRVTRVPKAPVDVLGVVNLHGEVVPVIDLAQRLRRGPTTVSPGSRLLVLNLPDETVAILAETVGKPTRVSLVDLEEAPEGTPDSGPGPSPQRVARCGDRFVSLIDAARTLCDPAPAGAPITATESDGVSDAARGP